MATRKSRNTSQTRAFSHHPIQQSCSLVSTHRAENACQHRKSPLLLLEFLFLAPALCESLCLAHWSLPLGSCITSS